MSQDKKTEELLTEVEIKEIEEEAAMHPELRQTHLINIFGKSHKTIFNLSFKHGLILIQGNDDTGYEHIRKRHEHYSRYAFWKKQIEEVGEKYALDTPSKFSPKSTPILDYVRIADELYKPENLNDQKNKNPNLFDMFSGKVVTHKNNLTYHLLIYKNSKIIHTLFPDKSIKKIKKLKGFNFSRGQISTSYNIFSGIIKIKFHYLDHLKKKKFLVEIEKKIKDKKEIITVSKLDDNEMPLDKRIVVENNKFQYYKNVAFESIYYEFADLRDLEKHILQF